MDATSVCHIRSRTVGVKSEFESRSAACSKCLLYYPKERECNES
jgi:hypothetical protein